MAFFGQGKDTIEWLEYRDDILFYKWKNNEIKRGSRLLIRPGQHAIFYSNNQIEGIFENPGNFDIETEITPFLSSLKGWFQLRGDTGMRAEVYFVNAKELVLNWGTRQRIMIPTPEVPSGIPIGMNGNMVIEFRDYLTFIEKVAGVKSTYTLADVSQRILAKMDGVVAEAVLGGEHAIGMNALVSIQANARTIGKKMAEEMDKELYDIGLGVREVNIISVNYPEEVQKMAEKVAGQSFVGDAGKYATIAMADGMEKGGGSVASMGAQMAVGAQIASEITKNAASNQQAQPEADRFCPSCRKMVNGKFCGDCGTETV